MRVVRKQKPVSSKTFKVPHFGEDVFCTVGKITSKVNKNPASHVFF